MSCLIVLSTDDYKYIKEFIESQENNNNQNNYQSSISYSRENDYSNNDNNYIDLSIREMSLLNIQDLKI